jgi:hypothetical protein
VIEDDQRGVVRICSPDPEVSEEEMDLPTICLMNLNADSALREDGLARSDVLARFPIGEELVEEPLHLLAVHITADSDGRSTRDPSSLVVRAQGSRLNLSDAL